MFLESSKRTLQEAGGWHYNLWPLKGPLLTCLWLQAHRMGRVNIRNTYFLGLPQWLFHDFFGKVALFSAADCQPQGSPKWSVLFKPQTRHGSNLSQVSAGFWFEANGLWFQPSQGSSGKEMTRSCTYDFFLVVLVVSRAPGRANSGLWLLWEY